MQVPVGWAPGYVHVCIIKPSKRLVLALHAYIHCMCARLVTNYWDEVPGRPKCLSFCYSPQKPRTSRIIMICLLMVWPSKRKSSCMKVGGHHTPSSHTDWMKTRSCTKLPVELNAAEVSRSRTKLRIEHDRGVLACQ